MTASVLQTYLRLQLLELNGEDSRLQKLEAASTELAAKFSTSPRDALSAFFAVLDDASITAESVSQAAEAIENHWSTYHGAFKDGQAATLYRAVILQAFIEAIEHEPALGSAISLLMRNFGQHLEIGKGRPAFDLLIEAADAAFENEAAAEVEQQSDQRVPFPQTIKAGKLDRAVIKKLVDAAVGPTNKENQPTENPNPQWPNSGQPWSHDFSLRFVSLFADHIDLAMARASEWDAKNFKSLAGYLEQPDRRYQKLSTSTSLLWWRQALYSESAKKPYRELEQADALIHAVIDLSSLVPPSYERALESFLAETILFLFPGSDEISQTAILNAGKNATRCLDEAIEIEAPKNLLFSSLISNGGTSPLLPASCRPHQWSVWLFREIKALQAISTIDPNAEGDGEDD